VEGDPGLGNLHKEGKPMGFLDSLVGRSFPDEQGARIVVFSGDRGTRGYVVRSEAEELKIRWFLKMFYFAHFSVLLLGMLLAMDGQRSSYTSTLWAGRIFAPI
jgi:hypothetical protein